MPAAVLTIDLNARIASLEAAVAQSNRSINLLASTTQKASGVMRSAFQGIFQGIGQELTFKALQTSLTSTIDKLDELNDRSKKTNVSTESLSALGYAAKQSGIDTEGLDKIIGKLNVSVLGAESGNKKTAAAFAALGVSLRDGNGQLKGTDQLIGDLDQGFSHLADGPIKAGLAGIILGNKSGTTFLQLNGELAGLTDEAKKFGLVVSQDVASQADEFNDRLGRLSAAGQGFRNQVTANLLPSLNAIAGAFLDDAKGTNGLKGAILDLTSDNSLFTFFSSALTLLAGFADGVLKAKNIVASFGSGLAAASLDDQEFLEKTRIATGGSLFGSQEDGAPDPSTILDRAAQMDAATKKYAAARQAAAEGAAADLSNESRFSDATAKLIAKARGVLNEPVVARKKGRSQDAALSDYLGAGGGEAAKKDPFAAYSQGLEGESNKLLFDVTNFDRFKGAAESSKRAVVEFDLEFGKFSDATRRSDGLKPITAEQKAYALSVADTIVVRAKQLKQESSLSAFDDQVKRIQLDTQYLNADNVSRETAIRLFDLEKAGVDKTSDAYRKRAEELKTALALQQQTSENRDVRAFLTQGKQGADDIQFQIGLLGKNKAAVEDLTSARQIDLQVLRATTNEDGSQKVTDQTLANYKASGGALKTFILSANAQLRSQQQLASTGAKQFFAEYTDAANDLGTQVKGALSNAFSNLEDQFVTFAQTGKLNFKGLVDSINADLLRIGFKQLASSAIQKVGSLAGIDTSGLAGTTASSAAQTAVSAGLTTFATTTAAADTALASMVTAAALASSALETLAGSSAGSSGISGLGDALAESGLLEFAKGGVFAGGGVVPFARGGVVSSPTYFPMSSGRAGLMGEAGPEAIVPLRRGQDGRLGIAMPQMRGGSVTNNTTIVNVPAPQTRDLRSASQYGRDVARQLSR